MLGILLMTRVSLNGTYTMHTIPVVTDTMFILVEMCVFIKLSLLDIAAMLYGLTSSFLGRNIFITCVGTAAQKS